MTTLAKETNLKATGWRGFWARLAAMEEAMDYSPTDYLLQRVKRLEETLEELRREVDALKQADNRTEEAQRGYGGGRLVSHPA